MRETLDFLLLSREDEIKNARRFIRVICVPVGGQHTMSDVI